MSEKYTKKLIKEYDFAKAEFESLPEEVFNTCPKNLSYNERVILDGIKFQMIVSKANIMSRNINYNIIIHSLSAGITLAVIGFFLLSLTYYANVNLHLGLNFLTEIFA